MGPCAGGQASGPIWSAFPHYLGASYEVAVAYDGGGDGPAGEADADRDGAFGWVGAFGSFTGVVPDFRPPAAEHPRPIRIGQQPIFGA